MAAKLTVGDVTAVPGKIQYGRWEALSHPTGNREFFPVIMAQGASDGPCLWLIAGVHGSEQAGPLAIYHLINEALVHQLQGTIVALPAMNPAGLRTMQREPYHADDDPNRIWPEKKSHPVADPDRDPPSSLEKAYARLYEEIVASADYFIDFHNAWIGSLSFALRDRILYQKNDAADRKRAHELADRLDQMVNAYGHTVVNEYPADTYIRENLHRTASGSVLQKSRIPAFTAELGTGLVPDPVILRAACAGTRNVMRWAGMLDDEPEAIEDIRVIRPGYPVCRMRTPRVQEACIVHHLVDAGMRVGKGDVVAEMRDVWGRPVGNGVIRSSHEGIVLGRTHGVYFYPGQPILTMAVRDSGSLTAPYPETVSQPAAP